jgi:hypothetical protein
MSEMTRHLEKRARTEIRYARGMEVMQRERYVEYCRDLRGARACGDFRRTREIIQDLAAFAGETAGLMHAHRRAFERLFMIRHGQEYTSALGPSPALPPAAARGGDLAESDHAPVRIAATNRRADSLEAPPRPIRALRGHDHGE